MKNFIKNNPPKDIRLPLKERELTMYHCYGTLIGGAKGFITQEQYCGNKFTVRCPHQITEGNGWSGYDSNNLIQTIKLVLKSPSNHVLQFSDCENLFAWLGGRKIYMNF